MSWFQQTVSYAIFFTLSTVILMHISKDDIISLRFSSLQKKLYMYFNQKTLHDKGESRVNRLK